MNSTTTKGLLDQVKATLLNYWNTTLKGVVTIKRGVLPPIPAFPAIAIMPEQEEYRYWAGKNRYWVNRELSIEVYSKGPTVKTAREETEKLIYQLIEIFKKDHQWNSNAVDSTWSKETYFEPITTGRSYIQGGVVTLIVTSDEETPSTEDYTDVTGTSVKDLIDTVYSTIETYKNSTGALSVSNIRKLEKQSIPAIADFPAVTIVIDYADRDRTYAGVDEVAYTLTISIFTKLLDKEVNLDSNLALLETVKDIIQKHNMWGGKALTTTVDRVLFFRDSVQNLGQVYRTDLEAVVKTFEYGGFPKV